ncbi:MAG: trypsin-like peptidase domain-containing protein [Pirellula sp.]|nr:trypsin-like peptidase domain-containing protein [Pirellula sp.]
MQHQSHCKAWLALFTLLVSLSTPLTVSSQQIPLDIAEETAMQAAANWAQGSVVQIETFGGMEIVNKQAVAPGPSTGTVLSKEGWIAASNFLFKGQPASITVILPNEERKAAKLVARDFSREIAILKIDGDESLRPAIPSDPAAWRVGQWTIALGKSFDVRTASRSLGILSAKGRIWDKAIQTDCKISPQNYGGPLIDLYGKTMGILTTINPGIVTEGEVEQWYDSGIGFAIPLADILERLPILQSGQDIHPGKAGFRVRGRDEFAEGIVLGGVSPGSPAAKAGLKAGDQVVRAGRSESTLKPVATHSNLKHAMGPIDAGQTFVLEVIRGSQTIQLPMSLVKELPAYREPYLGIITAKRPDASEEILLVLKDSPASLAGLKAGDRITRFSKESLTNESSFEQQLPFWDYREPLPLQIRKADGAEQTVTLQPTVRPVGDVTVQSFTFPVGKKEESKEGADEAKSPAKGTVQIPIGDVKNKAFAIVPTTYSPEVPHGLLVVYADAGPQDAKTWSDLWERFGLENRWIVAVIQSADEQSWSFEEVEIGTRVRSYLGTNYSIDKRRTCAAGIASGGVLALVTVAQFPDDFNALWLSDSKIGGRVRLASAEPGKSPKFFINGTDDSLSGFVERITEAGYAASYYKETWSTLKSPDAANAQDSQIFSKVQRFLQHLEAL